MSPSSPSLPFDLDYVIRKANLRRDGWQGAVTLVLALRDLGYDADVLKRAARQEALRRLTGILMYVKEQEQFAMRIGGQLVSLHLDTDWQQVLDRFHARVSFRNLNNGIPQTIHTLESYFIAPSRKMEDEEMAKGVMTEKRRLVRELIYQTSEEKSIAKRRAPWKVPPKMIDITGNPPVDPEGTSYPSEESLQYLATQETPSSASFGMGRALTLMSEPSQAKVRPFVIIGCPDNPRIIDGYRPSIECLSTGNQLILGPEGSWSGLCEKDRERLGDGMQIFMGDEIVFETKLNPQTVKPAQSNPWEMEVKRFSLLQTALATSPQQQRPTAPKRKF